MITPSTAYLTEHAKASRCPIYQVKVSERNGTTVVTQPTAYWKLDDVEGTRIDSMNLAHMAMSGTVTYTTGKLKNAAAFTLGSNYLSTPDQAAIRTGAQDWSFSIWVNLQSKPDYMGIASKTSGTVAQQEWLLWYDQSADRFTFTLYYNSGNSAVTVTASSFGAPSLNTWYHLVITHTAATKTIGIRVNNGTENTNTYAGTNANAGASPMYLGLNYAAAPKSLDGYLDEAALWIGYKLSNTEIATLYSSGSAFALSGFSTTREVATFSTSWPITGEDLGPEILVPIELAQRMEVDRCRLPASTFTFLLQDIGNQATDIISTGIVGMQCDFYMGFYHIQWAATPANYEKRFSGTISEIEYDRGSYRVTVRSSITGAQDKILFNGASSQLASNISDVSTSLSVDDASAFDDAFDLPQSFRRPMMIGSEIMVYRAKSGNTLSSIQRAGSVGYAVPPRAAAATSHVIGEFVRELVKLGDITNQNDQLGAYQTDDLHPIELLKQPFNLTGKHGFSEANLEYDETSLDAAKATIGATAQFRFLHDDSVNAKRLLEEELYLPLASTPTETVDGKLGIKLYADVVIASPPTNETITDAHIVDFPKWLRNAEKIINVVIYHYGYFPPTKEYTETYTYRDQTAIDALGRESVLEIFSKGIRAYMTAGGGTQEWFNYTTTLLAARAQAHVDRFGSITPIIGVTTLLSKNLLECGDEVLCTFSQVINLGTAERSITSEPFEIVAMRTDFQRNVIEMELLGFPA